MESIEHMQQLTMTMLRQDHALNDSQYTQGYRDVVLPSDSNMTE
jgi:hypothetical protein